MAIVCMVCTIGVNEFMYIEKVGQTIIYEFTVNFNKNQSHPYDELKLNLKNECLFLNLSHIYMQ